MGATAAPAKRGSAMGPANGLGKGKMTFVSVNVTGPASYDNPGGSVLTQPTGRSGLGKLAMVVVPALRGGTVVDRVYGWNGSVTAPKLVAMVMSTGAEVANATPLNGDTIPVIFVYEQ